MAESWPTDPARRFTAVCRATGWSDTPLVHLGGLALTGTEKWHDDRLNLDVGTIATGQGRDERAGGTPPMSDKPVGAHATFSILHTGYGSSGVASTVGLVRDADVTVVTDPGMVAHRRLILDPLRALGIEPEAVTDVVLSHHHPDHTMNVALFPNARVHDHWAIYRGDRWIWRDAEGYRLTPSITLIRTPGHTREDITTLAGTPEGVVAFTHAWNNAGSVGDRHAVDLDELHVARERVLAVADIVVPGHGPAFPPDASTPR